MCEKNCVCERKIAKLPYVISKAGQYCLCRDFVWNDNTQAAITILNTENVVLNFYQKKITNNTPTTLGIISVQNSTNIELKNIHLQGEQIERNSIDEFLQYSNQTIPNSRF